MNRSNGKITIKVSEIIEKNMLIRMMGVVQLGFLSTKKTPPKNTKQDIGNMHM